MLVSFCCWSPKSFAPHSWDETSWPVSYGQIHQSCEVHKILSPRWQLCLNGSTKSTEGTKGRLLPLQVLTLFPFILIFIITRFWSLCIQVCQFVCLGWIPYKCWNRLGSGGCKILKGTLSGIPCIKPWLKILWSMKICTPPVPKYILGRREYLWPFLFL